MDLIKFVTLFMWLWRNSSKNSKGERGGVKNMMWDYSLIMKVPKKSPLEAQ